ncbi:MAG: hypothetical protein FWG22_00355 [Prolixibacteraceae bacterium]|nr:hypothetical protein [Prolixibacteraceae bacterium]
MKRDFSKPVHHEKADKIEKRIAAPGPAKKEKSSKRKLSIYDDFNDEDNLDTWDSKSAKPQKNNR